MDESHDDSKHTTTADTAEVQASGRHDHEIDDQVNVESERNIYLYIFFRFTHTTKTEKYSFHL